MGTMRRINSCLAILPSLLLTWFFFFGISHAADTLKAGDVMRDWQSLDSPGGIFRLEFFKAPDFSSNRYLGIRYIYFPDSPPEDVVWVANREDPLMDTSGVLNMTQDGKLVITDSRGISVTINSEQPATSSNTSVILLDSGNLVLREGERIVWQSFDYPTDSFLQGMKLGIFELKMGRPYNRSLTSWLTPKAAVEGAFTLGVDPKNAKQLVIRRRGALYWRSGIWNGSTFSNFADDGLLNHFNFSYFSNENESYFTFTVTNNTGSWIKMNSSGQIEVRVFEISFDAFLLLSRSCEDVEEGLRLKGCVTPEPSGCRSGDLFSPLPDAVQYGEFEELDNSSMCLSDCREICLRNCSCYAYASFNSNGIGCVLALSQGDGLYYSGVQFYGRNYSFFPIYLATSIAPAPLLLIDGTVEKDRQRKRKRQLWLAVGASVVSLIILTVISILCYLRRLRRIFGGENGSNRDGINGDTELLLYNEGNSIAALNELSGAHKLELSGKKVHELPLFKFSSIEIATDHFSDANKLGKGGFGVVYKGKLAQGQEIAVKRLSRNSRQGIKEFKNEVVLISKLQHRNLVRLLGCCIQGEERILIYEYMPNNSLDSFLFDATRQALLDWNKRVRIIEGIAQGLLYLHKYSRLKIIHRDLKTSNILLDGDMNPKISDFGTARIFGENESYASTNRIVGTYGYMSPEYALNGLFSVKSDVFSFGVMMLEIISGKKSNGYYQSNCSSNLLGYAWDFYKEGRCLELVDPALEESYSRNEVLRYVQVGLLCVQESAVDRPTMSDVVSMLSNESMTLPIPKQPAFSSTVGANDAALLENPRPLACSLNDVTITEMEAR